MNFLTELTDMAGDAMGNLYNIHYGRRTTTREY